MKYLRLVIISIMLIIGFNGCFERELTDAEASKLPVCVETSDNMYTISQGSIGEVGGYYKQLLGDEVFTMHPRKGGKQLIFKVENETILLDTNYQALEKGACMEIVYVKVTDESGKIVLEADSSNAIDYRDLTKVAEYIFKF